VGPIASVPMGDCATIRWECAGSPPLWRHPEALWRSPSRTLRRAPACEAIHRCDDSGLSRVTAALPCRFASTFN
jgi:hypothetical protein